MLYFNFCGLHINLQLAVRALVDDDDDDDNSYDDDNDDDVFSFDCRVWSKIPFITNSQ